MEAKEKTWTDKEYTEAVARAYKAGIKEVVEFIKGEISMKMTDNGIFITGFIAGAKWQAKLKEWGID